MENLEKQLNNSDVEIRINSLKEIFLKQGKRDIPEYIDINNHIHTSYSFSPYSPTYALWRAYQEGLTTAGIMDHDTVSGIKEFKRAAAVLNFPATCGLECRVKANTSFLNDKRINNPDQKGIMYVAIHGIAEKYVEEFDEYFAEKRQYRNIRNRKMTDKINEMIKCLDIYLDFDNDILPISSNEKGGSVTERHLLYALSLKLTKKYGKTKELIEILKNDLNIEINESAENRLLDKANTCFHYDLLGVLKGNMVSSFYIPADKECFDARKLVAFAKKRMAIPAYAYLGDVENSVTGDKKQQKFEDEYLDELIKEVVDMGFMAIAYMPTRNTDKQLSRIRKLIKENGLIEICGEDINSPRQKFICEKIRGEEYKSLRDSSFALISNEYEIQNNLSKGIYGDLSISELAEKSAKKYDVKNI